MCMPLCGTAAHPFGRLLAFVGRTSHQATGICVQELRPSEGSCWFVSLSGRFHSIGAETLGKLVVPSFRARWLRRLPDPWRRRRYPAPWPRSAAETPEQLKTVPGIWRDPAAEQKAYSEGPQYSFNALHAPELLPMVKYMWRSLLPSMPGMHRISAVIRDLAAEQPSGEAPALDPQSLTDELRREAERIGLSEVGFAPYDPKYTFAEALVPQTTDGVMLPRRAGPPDDGSVIVCILEQDWKKTQTIPSVQAERDVQRTYEGLVERAATIARLLHEKGFRADVHGPAGVAISIHYAVQAGLGQLGLNGQLLTPRAGSRCRLTLITTNALLVHDEPVDYGIHAICDACQVCVRRCPPGAIPKQRAYHRGIMKAKIKSDRCFPILQQAHGCAICMKVCPVQRYGLEAVTSRFVETGEILGKGTDELEGFNWIDGRRYGPGEKPRMSERLLHPGGIVIDSGRRTPP
jgi:epoxyqueuosine reductase